MAGLNKIQLIGRLGREPEARFTPRGTKVCSFSLAVNRRWKDGEGESKEATDWFQIETWGRLADICQEYLDKGSLVYLEGRLQIDRVEKDEEVQYYTKVIARQMQMLSGKGAASMEEEAGEPVEAAA